MTYTRLRTEHFEISLLREFGGMVASLDWLCDGRRLPLLYPSKGTEERETTASRYGLWPMLPFANRAFGAQLLVGDETIGVPANDPAGAIHGYGWQHEWVIEAQQPDALTLVHEYIKADPYRYGARMRIALHEDSVEFTLNIRNTGTRPLPFGLGFHPWFGSDADMSLRFRAARNLILDENLRAQGVESLNAAYDFSAPRGLPAKTIAASLIDWDGALELRYPARNLSLLLEASENLRHPVFWAPEEAKFLCFEPQSHAIGAPSEKIAAAATPLKLLAPGESMEGSMRLTPGLISR